MKTQSRKPAGTQSEQLNFAPSPLGASALNASRLPAAPERAERAELPEGWQTQMIALAVDETTSGDWGEAEPGAGLIECRVLRGTDFRRAADGNLFEAPIRHVRQSSVEKRQLRVNDLLV